jgi:hypothetical protein
MAMVQVCQALEAMARAHPSLRGNGVELERPEARD